MLFNINAKIIVTVTELPTLTGNEEITFNPITGQPIFGVFDPDTETTTPPVEEQIIIECSLDWAETEQEMKPIPGRDLTGMYLEGRAMSDIPQEYTVETIYGFEYLVGSEFIGARFLSQPIINGRLGLESIFGTLIAGYLIEG